MRPVLRFVNVGTSLLSSVLRAGSGRSVGPLGDRPEQPLILYDFEGCPFCRKVREALSMLDLDAEIRPCPKNGPRFREEVKRRGGRLSFPYLVDPHTGSEMYESDDIVRYLYSRYGQGEIPRWLSGGVMTNFSSALANLPRPARGVFYRPARQPAQALELWSFEASPFCRIVRESLTTLELPYRLHNVAKGSRQRQAFVARSGKLQVPYLVDPNEGVALFESAAIVGFLEETYRLSGAH
ncbi:MAG: glutathione S-transferase N-terminal domain-containing protein [Myxococcota bacterium]